MLQFTLRISGDSSSEELRNKIDEIRRFVITTMSDVEFVELEVYSGEVASRSPYGYRGYQPVSRPFLPQFIPYDSPGQSYIVTTREDAVNVLDKMKDIINKYSVVTVSDLNEMLGLKTTAAQTKSGWTDVSGFNIRQVKDGWSLEPSPIVALP